MFASETLILVVDDMPSIRDMVKTQLKTMGYKNVIEAENGEDALNMLNKSWGSANPVGLVISDWNMPKMKGLEFLKQVRANPEMANLTFVLLTSESEREQVTEAVLAGVSQYIVKPFSGKTFEEKLKTAWAKHHKA